MPETADIVIVGGGVMGCAIAYNLALQGLKPVVVEKADIGGEASGANGGGVRQSARNLKEMPLAMESIRLYGGLAEELGMDVEYVRQGNLRLCTVEDEVRAMAASVENQRSVGLELEMLDQKQVREILPFISENVIGAGWCPTDGHVNPFLVTYAFMKKAKELGAVFYTREEVLDINLKKSRVAAVTTAKRKIATDTVVNAAGVTGRRVANMVGLDLPLKPVFSEALITEATEPMFQQMIGSAKGLFYGRQTVHGSIFWGGFIGIEDYVYQRQGKPMYNCIGPASARSLIDLFPVMAKLNVIRSWSGLIAAMSDGIPVLGLTDEVPGYVFATGFSGHGFGLAPVIGRVISEVIMDCQPSLSLKEFCYGRFDRGGQSGCECQDNAACTIETAACPNKRSWLKNI